MEIFKKLFLRNLITLTIDILAAYFKQGPCPNARELAFHAVTTNQSMSDRQSKDRRSRSAIFFLRSDRDRRLSFSQKIVVRSAIAKSMIGIAKNAIFIAII